MAIFHVLCCNIWHQMLDYAMQLGSKEQKQTGVSFFGEKRSTKLLYIQLVKLKMGSTINIFDYFLSFYP